VSEPLKNQVDRAVLDRIAARFVSVEPGFDASRFVDDLAVELPDLELKDRIAAIARGLHSELPQPYPDALDVVVAASRQPEPERGDFDGWPLCTFVEVYGVEHPDDSLAAMEHLSLGFSCEFAVRPFLTEHTETTFRRLEGWTRHPMAVVRRLVSEGTRPLLPWGIRVPHLLAEPERGLRLIDSMHRDRDPAVRRSVANHLNDVAKDHPDLAAATARRWSTDGTRETDQLLRRGLRTLVKQGHRDALEILGFTTEAAVEVENFSLTPAAIALGDTLEIMATIRSTSDRNQKLVVDYTIHHVKANGSTTPKVFKWTTVDLAPGATTHLRTQHPVREITTRRYYPGPHRIELTIAGEAVAETAFGLRVE
jgi:3-methyladenine DNA glycosylase AlkC